MAQLAPKLFQNRSDSMPRKKIKTFEESIEQIDSIILQMENENISLDKSLELYQDGLNLINDCYEKIKDVQEKVYVLDNDFNLKIFDEAGE